ncbi:hypothetical protein H0266_15195 [Halobacillus locisalis]|uniref:Zinc transport system substrate-binding protein n=1 Tax=Halobacillus locisalis TaxID=220753 RepID=A0A838CVR7_9BACI|nr:hypothetical protein [Halobacillus locisalis]MBA2176242.1 hypothetical protein [Halobacillus locisalis]
MIRKWVWLLALIGLLAACSEKEAPVEEPQEVEAEESADVVEDHVESVDEHAEGEEDGHGHAHAHGESFVVDSTKPLEDFSERYQEIARTLGDYELPEEGRLTLEEWGEKYGESRLVNPEDYIYYENGYTFAKATKDLNSITSLPPDHIQADPYGTQALGSFKTNIVTLAFGLQEEPEEDQVQEMSRMVADELGKLEPFLQEYEMIAEWTRETRGYFVEAADGGGHDVFHQGNENLQEMKGLILTINREHWE